MKMNVMFAIAVAVVPVMFAAPVSSRQLNDWFIWRLFFAMISKSGVELALNAVTLWIWSGLTRNESE